MLKTVVGQRDYHIQDKHICVYEFISMSIFIYLSSIYPVRIWKEIKTKAIIRMYKKSCPRKQRKILGY